MVLFSHKIHAEVLSEAQEDTLHPTPRTPSTSLSLDDSLQGLLILHTEHTPAEGLGAPGCSLLTYSPQEPQGKPPLHLQISAQMSPLNETNCFKIWQLCPEPRILISLPALLLSAFIPSPTTPAVQPDQVVAP